MSRALIASLLLTSANAHGFLSKPLARNTLGNSKLYDCSWSGPGARCNGDYMSLGGVTGPDTTGCAPRGGKLGVTGTGGLSFATTGYKTAYVKGQVIEIEVEVTAFHGGKFEYRLQDVGAANDPDVNAWSAPLPVLSFSPPCDTCTATEPCAPTATAPGTCSQIPLTKPDGSDRIYKVLVQLPADVECDHCVLQWHWTSSNSCPDKGIACDASEQFWNCADIQIAGNSNTPATPTPVPAATPATPATPSTPTTPSTPATPPASGDDMSCCRSIQAHIGDAWCQDDCASMVAAYPDTCVVTACGGGGNDDPTPVPAPVPVPESSPTPATPAPPTPTTAPAPSPSSSSGDCGPASCHSVKAHIGDAWCQDNCASMVAAYPDTCVMDACDGTSTTPATAPAPSAPTPTPAPATTPGSGGSDCNSFKSHCQSACISRAGSNGVATNQCWGSPLLYVECKCSDGAVLDFDGFVCAHSTCPGKTSTPATTPPPATTPATTPGSVAAAFEAALDRSASGFTSDVLLYETPTGAWQPSSVYKFADLRVAITQMYTKGIGSRKLLLGESVEEALVNIAAFIAQSMKETIKYDACDENSWDLVAGKYPASNACGQLGQSYQDYTCPAGEEHMQCEVDPDLEITATTNAKWYGAPGPMKCGPKSKMPQPGYWDYSKQCDKPWASPPESCADYAGQKAGGWVTGVDTPNANGRTDVEGCCYWGRGVIQTTGICNFGKLNYWLGKRAAREGRDAAYPDVDFCREPDAICASTQHPELKWIAGLFYWAESVQTYSTGGWEYKAELKKFVDGGMQRPGTDAGFIHAVSGIVNRGCHSPPCGSGALDGGAERARNFEKVLKAMGLVTTRKLSGRPNTKLLRGV